MAAKTRRSGIGIRRRAQACRERTPTATTTATTVMYRALRNKLSHTSAAELRLVAFLVRQASEVWDEFQVHQNL